VRRWFCSGAVCAVLTAIPVSGASALPDRGLRLVAGHGSSACSTAEAERLAAKFSMGDANYGRVAQVLCGSFTGAKSNTMAFSFHWYGCRPVQGWAVFRAVGDDWQLVTRRDRESAVLSAAGPDIRTKVDVFRPGDSHCVSTGGTISRLWHWNGTQLVAGASTQLTPPAALTVAQFYSPSRNIDCGLSDGSPHGVAGASCWSVRPTNRVTLAVNGTLKICRGAQRCTANFGESPVPRVLAYGRQITVGRFRCRSLSSGVKCVVLSSGKGFLISRSGVAGVG
jgi:hypothetical protein